MDTSLKKKKKKRGAQEPKTNEKTPKKTKTHTHKIQAFTPK